MKKLLLSAILLFGVAIGVRGQQYVTIPDANFSTALQQYGCMNGNQLDISLATKVTYIVCSNDNITNMWGIQYFTNLTYLDCSWNEINYFNDNSGNFLLPVSLNYLNCQGDYLDDAGPFLTESYFPLLTNLTYLNCANNSLSIVFFPPRIKYFIGSNCDFSTVQGSPPNTLTHLDLSYNVFTSLEFNLLPQNLKYLNITYNYIGSLDTIFPISLDTLECANNMLQLLDYLPDTITYVDVSNNPDLNRLIPTRIHYLNFNKTGISCFISYGNVFSSSPLITSYPLCGNNFITIPDSNFVNWLNANGYSGCMQGNLMDTICAKETPFLQTPTLTISHQNIADFTGLQYLGMPGTYPTNIDLSYNALNKFPTQIYDMLNFSILNINLSHNNIDSFYLDKNHFQYFDTLDLSYNNMLSFKADSILGWPYFFQGLKLNNNKLTMYPYIFSQVSGLESGNEMQYYLDIRHNYLTIAPGGNFGYLDCGVNLLTSFQIDAPFNGVGLNLYCDSNNITSMTIDSSAYVFILDCSHNQISSINSVGSTIVRLICSDNHLTQLPALTTDYLQFEYLDCSNNPIFSLPTLPSFLSTIICNNDSLLSLPALPANITTLNCSNNPLPCLPILTTIGSLNFNNTNVSCIPNLGNVTSSTPPLSSIPICNFLNKNGCPVLWNVQGKVYLDINGNCIFDSTDYALSNVKVELFSHNILQQQVFTDTGGNYSFVSDGILVDYMVQVDTAGLPYTFSCPMNGAYQDTITANNVHFLDQNFALKCDSIEVADVGVVAISGKPHTFHPNEQSQINLLAGDISTLYTNFHCLPPGEAGFVQLIFEGPITFTGVVPGALTPTYVQGDTLTWVINDFSTININTAFGLYFFTNPNAVLGTPVCFYATALLDSGDINPMNDTLSYCFIVHNPNDPNSKDAYPSSIIDSNSECITYSIEFQNTGNAPAVNIYVDDTLSSNLDLSTIQLLCYSSPSFTQVLPGGIVRFNFPNINLPDSIDDPPGSIGYVRFKIKLKPDLPVGTPIQNTAYVYFDSNPAVVTNTTTNVFVNLSPSVISTTPKGICQGSNIILHAGGVANLSYQWMLDDTPLNNATDSIYTTNVPGSYSVQTAYDGDTIISSPITVSILALPNVSLKPANNSTCENGPSIVLNPSPSGGVFSGIGVDGNSFNPTVGNPGEDTIIYTYTDSSGCIGMAVTSIKVLPIPTSTFDQSICPGQNYLGYSIAGTYIDTLRGAASDGCDSILILNLTVLPVTASITDYSICPGQSYSGYSAAGTYVDTLLGAASDGCDSISILNLTILPDPSSVINQSICSGQSYLGHFTAGTYVDTLRGMAANGCDSIRTLNLTILPTYNDTTSQTLCVGDTFQGQALSGFYSDTFISSNGCDSILTLHLIVLPTFYDTVSQTICQEQSYEGHSTAGIYTDTLTASSGCDSIRTIYLNILQPVYDTVHQTICQGQSYAGYSIAGIYTDTLTASSGCDSIRTIYLAVLQPVYDTVDQIICQGQFYEGHSTAGIYTDTLISSNGCDSIRSLNLTVLPAYNDTISQSICQGTSFEGHTETGYYTNSLKTTAGCDSIVTLYLYVAPVYQYVIKQAICQGESFDGHTVSGAYIDTLASSSGCDSIIALELDVMPVYSDTNPVTICQGESFEGHTAAGYYTDTFNSVFGCDSIVTLNLMVQSLAHYSITQQICQGDSFLHHSTSGTYIDTISNAFGCDSIRTLYLTVNESVYDTLYDTTWTNTHDTSFVHYDTLIAANGCDSIVTLFLTVKDTATGISTLNNVEPQLNLFPNPASTSINLSATFEMDGYVVYNPEGQEITRRDNIKVKQATIDLQGWAKGVYFLEATVGQQKMVKRFAVL